jgi:hypothetical protein
MRVAMVALLVLFVVACDSAIDSNEAPGTDMISTPIAEQTWVEMSPEFTAAAIVAFDAHSAWLQNQEDPTTPRRLYAVVEDDGSYHFDFMPASPYVRDGGVVYVIESSDFTLRCQYFSPAQGCSP